MSDSRTRFSVRWQCGSSSTAIGTFVADDRPHALDEVALGVVIAIGDHRPVQAEQHAVDRHRGGKLGEDLVAHLLVVGLLRRARRLGPEARALDELEPFLPGAPARDVERRRGVARDIRMLPRRIVERRLVARAVGRDRGEGVRLGGERGGEEAHADSGLLRGKAAVECGFSQGPAKTARHVSNAQDHDLAASGPDGIEQAVSEWRQRHAMEIGLVRFASHAWRLAPEGLQWLRADRERLARLSGCHGRCNRRLLRSAPKRPRCNEPSPLPQTSEQGCDLLVRRHLAPFDFGQGLIDVGTLLVREVVDALGPVLQDEQHLGRLFLPVEGPLARRARKSRRSVPGSCPHDNQSQRKRERAAACDRRPTGRGRTMTALAQKDRARVRHARGGDRPRPGRAQHRPRAGRLRRGGRRQPAAHQDAQDPGHRQDAARRRRFRHHLPEDRRGRGDVRGRARRHPDQLQPPRRGQDGAPRQGHGAGDA